MGGIGKCSFCGVWSTNATIIKAHFTSFNDVITWHLLAPPPTSSPTIDISHPKTTHHVWPCLPLLVQQSQDVNVSNNLILSTLQKEIRPHFYRQFPLMARQTASKSNLWQVLFSLAPDCPVEVEGHPGPEVIARKKSMPKLPCSRLLCN